MSKPTRRDRALRPLPESLEERKLLSKTVTGTDSDGDTWTLQLIGPGDLRVVKQNDTTGNPASLKSLTDIKSIEVAGGNPNTTRLVGKVTKNPGGDGEVFFQNLTEIGGRSESEPSANGIQSVDIPGFWLGNTTGAVASLTASPTGQINIPDGVVTLRFGGVDTTFGPQPPSTSATTPAPNDFAINLGLPRSIGTSIIVNKVVSSATPGVSSGGVPATPVQNQVTFTIDGRLNLFQADEIDGSTAFPSTGFQGGGGTVVVSTPDPLTAITGQIGFVRIGGNATDFSVQTNDKVSDFFVGGEANTLFLLAPAGSRDIYFGKGMDTVTIDTHTLSTLQANRGALNSNVTVERAAGKIIIGGDAVNTNIISGNNANFGAEFTRQSEPTTPPPAQDGGAMTVLVAGDVTNSVFAASVEPLKNVFSTVNDLNLPHGHISAKIEGTIDNSTATPDSPDIAFYAKSVTLSRGPVIPPTVPEAPFPPAVFHRGQLSLTLPNPLSKKTVTKPPAKNTAASTQQAQKSALVQNIAPTHIAAHLPTGPSSKSKKKAL